MTQPTFDLIAPPHAPFKSDGSLNLAVIEQQAAHYEAHHIDGVFVSGTTGESSSLTVPERLAIAERWSEVTHKSDMTVIVQVGHNCVADSVQMAQHAQGVGADAVAMMSPSFLKPASVADLIACCEPVAKAAPDLPFYLYDIPNLTNVRLPLDQFLEQGRERIPNLKGLKFTNPDLVLLQECLAVGDGEFDILFGCDEILLGGVAMGCRGAVGSTYNFVAEQNRQFVTAFLNGDLAAARAGQFQAVKMIRLLQRYSFLPASKAVMSFFGVNCGPVRAPLKNLTEAEIKELRNDWLELEINLPDAAPVE